MPPNTEVDDTRDDIRSPWMRIQVFIVFITAVAVALTAFLGYQTYQASRQAALGQFNEQQLILARSAAAGIETYFSEVRAALVSATKVRSIQLMTPTCLEYMQNMYLGFIPRTSIRRLDENGYLKCIYPSDGWREDLIGRDYEEDQYFRNARETGNVILSGITVNEMGENRIRMAAPVYTRGPGDDDDKVFKGILVVSFDLQSIADVFISPIVSGETGYAWLINQEGYFLAHYFEDFVGRSAFKVRKEKAPELSFESINDIQRGTLAGREGIGRYISGWHRGQTGRIEKLIAYCPARVVNQTWSVAVVAPTDEVDYILRSAGTTALNTFASIIIILLIAGGFTFFTTHRWSELLRREVRKRTKELRENEARFRSLFEGAPDAIFLASTDTGIIIDVNPAACRLLGMSRNDLVGLHQSRLHPPEHRRDAATVFSNHARRIEPISESIVQRNDGTQVPVEIMSELITIQGERVMQGIFRDITQRKRTENRLRENEERFRRIFEGGALGIAVLSLGYRFEQVNTRLCAMLGYEESELIGKTYLDITHPEHAEQDKKEVARLLQGDKRFYKTEKRYIKKDGGFIWASLTASVVQDENDKPLYFIAMIDDITNKKRVEDEKKHLEAQLLHAQKMEALGTLVAGVAHEINNPVNKIIFDMPLMQKVWNDVMPLIEEDAKKNPGAKYGGLTFDFLKENLPVLLADMKMAANRVVRTVENLKHYSRQSSISEKAPVSVNQAVENAIRLIETTLRKSGIKLELNLSGDPPVIEGNLQSIEQIVMNITINAVQALDESGGTIRISTELKKRSRKVVLTIEDNGKGIDPSIADRIFDPFVTSRQSEGGTGLGLPITYNLVEAHGGRISFESVPGKGTTFTILFPAVPNDTGR